MPKKCVYSTVKAVLKNNLKINEIFLLNNLEIKIKRFTFAIRNKTKHFKRQTR